MDILVVLVIVLVIVLIWRGPKVLPEWGAALGKGIREARTHATKGLGDGDSETQALPDGSASDLSSPTTAATRADTTSAPRS